MYFFSPCDKVVSKKPPPKPVATQACPGKNKPAPAKESSSSEDSSDSSDDEKQPAKKKPKSGKHLPLLLLCGRILPAGQQDYQLPATGKSCCPQASKQW